MTLSDIPSLAHLTPEQVENLHNICEERTLEDGENLICKDVEGGKLYFLLAGQLEVYVQEQGGEVILNRLTAPAVLGELELLTSHKRSASVRSAGVARVLGLDHDKIEARVRAGEVPVLQAMYGVSQVVAQRLVSLSEKFVELESRDRPVDARELRNFREKLLSDWSA
jgi:CRP-like cAMP-binding protein